MIVMLLTTLSILVSLSPRAAAASSKTWTTDVDFDCAQPGVNCNSVHVVNGTGPSARVDLLKDVTDWANKAPSSAPSAREGPGLTYDSTHGVSILYGGYDGFARYDTWKYNFTTNVWTQIATTGHPPGFEFPALSYDPTNHVVVLFGGYNGTGGTNGYWSDTWEFNVNTNTWTQYTPAGAPGAFISWELAYYASQSRHVLFGMNYSTLGMQTWAYDAGAHAWTNRNPGTSPSARANFAMTYHAQRDRVVVFSGANPSFPTPTFRTDTVEYNYVANSWTVTANGGPTQRVQHSMTYRPAANAAIMFGGNDAGSTYYTDTWQYTGSWTQLTTATSPTPRGYAGFTFDALNDVAVLFGGSYLGSNLGDTWTLGASYRAAGRYTSAVFDSGGANVVWGDLWWNKTPANQPANTYIRFDLATADAPSGPWTYVAADCVSTWSTTTPAPIGSCFDNHEYLTFLVDFGSFDTQFTPSMEDVTITYTVPIAPPYMVNTNPSNDQVVTGVPAVQPIWINFSKPMNTTTVTVVLQAFNPPTARVPSLTRWWRNNDRWLTLNHTVGFQENTVYNVTVDGKDKGGLSLIPNPNDPMAMNPWYFVTEKIFPWITLTNPASQQQDVLNNSAVVVTFSEPMRTSSLGVNLTPPDVTFTPSWSNMNQTVTLTHAVPFQNCMIYTIGINATDESGLPLDNGAPGAKSNPWTFYTHCPDPYITSQVPGNLLQNVSLTQLIIVDFSEPMQTTQPPFSFSISPTVGGLSYAWSLGNRRVTVSHSAFTTCVAYTVTIQGKDADEGLPLIQNPFNSAIKNPWKFETTCPNPYPVWTDPANGDTNVPVNKEVRIFFSKQMNTGSFQYVVTGGPYREISQTWDVQTLVHITHLAFRECTRYTFDITQAYDTSGNPLVPGIAPNPWSFDVECVSPYVVSTDPVNASTLVPVNKSVVVNFSTAMDTSTVIYSFAPPVSGVVKTWSNGNKTLTLSHPGNDFAACTQYTAFVDGNDVAGRPLLTGPNAPFAPDPWIFTTRCAGFYIVREDPADQQTGVPFAYPITVEFSVAANPSSFQIAVSPLGGTFTPSWSAGNTIVTVTHSQAFSDCVVYQASVSARDTSNNLLTNVSGSKPNPWHFKAQCIPPQITNTDPGNNANGVALNKAIVVTFSEAIVTSTLLWTINPNPGLNPAWSGGNTIVTFSHTALFLPNTRYTVNITRARDVDGNDLVAGPVPNPWSFTTAQGLQAPSGLRVQRASPNIVLLWNAVVNATSYTIYSVTNRLNLWPWPSIGTSPTPSFIHNGAYGDGSCHYYIVRAFNGPVSSGNSTMGVKCPLSFSYSPSRPNIYWLSLPYRSKYHSAKDITDELGPRDTLIDVVGKWNPATQTSIVWAYFRGAWRGVNFPIYPGDGIYISVHSTFPPPGWILNGTDGSVAHAFTVYPNANINWFSLPWTSPYVRASDIVREIAGGLGPGTNTRIDLIAIWDSATQSVVTFQYTVSGWTGGTDFLLSRNGWPDGATGIYFHVTSSFTWTPRLITPEV